jgi:hypothetical protein
MSEEEDDGRVLLHDEIAEILRAGGAESMTTQEIADQVNARGRYIKHDRSEVKAFQIKLRTKNYPLLFDQDGERIFLKPARAELTFNLLLSAVGIDPAEVRLVRHRDPNHQREVFDVALAGGPELRALPGNPGQPEGHPAVSHSALPRRLRCRPDDPGHSVRRRVGADR